MTYQESNRLSKWGTSLAYAMAMGCCGIVLVAIGSTFEDLAYLVNKGTTELGTVFIIRGFGSIVGTVSCSKLFSWFSGNNVLSSSLAVIMLMLIMIPFSLNSSQLHAYFFFLGLGTSITDTGCQLMTRKLHGKDAGPWLGVNATVFGLSAAFVPVLELLSSNMMTRYAIFASIVAFSFCYMVHIANGQETNSDSTTLLTTATQKSATSLNHESVNVAVTIPHYRTEIVIAGMLFCFVGGGVSATAYLESYVEQTGAINRIHKDKLFLALWLAITVGRFLGVYVQRFLCNKGVVYSLSIFSSGGFFGMFLIFLFPSSPRALWIGTVVYGLFHGPTVGFCQDLNNRLTLLGENSMAIVMFGLVCGASVVPFLTGFLWKYNEMPSIFPIIVGLSMLVPLPLLYLANYLSYMRSLPNTKALGLETFYTNKYQSVTTDNHGNYDYQGIKITDIDTIENNYKNKVSSIDNDVEGLYDSNGIKLTK